MNYLLVALGGAIGSAARYGMNVLSGHLFGSDYPWHTLIVNVLGCFVMGVVVALAALKLNFSNEVRLFLMTGILGGFTTFSAFALDFALMAERREFTLAGGYVMASVVFSISACFAGLAVVRTLLA
jgi:fluoride exporter